MIGAGTAANGAYLRGERRGLPWLHRAHLVVEDAQDVPVLRPLRLAELLEVVERFREALALVVVEAVRCPRDLAAGVVVVAAMDCPVLALADAVVVLEEALVEARVDVVDLVFDVVPMSLIWNGVN